MSKTRIPQIIVMSLKLIEDSFERLAAISSVKEKMRWIAMTCDCEFGALFEEVVYRALNPYLTYKMAGAIPLPEEERALSENVSILVGEVFKRLAYFNTVTALTNQEKQDFSDLVRSGGSYLVGMVNRILNKDLRCGASILTFRKACDAFEILPVHHPMKGIDDLVKFYKQAGRRKNICWSYKLDGTRTWAIVDRRSVLYLSSNGKELPNFHCFDEELRDAAEKLRPYQNFNEVVFDGEVINIYGDFSKHMSQFRRLNDMDPSGFRFRIFDIQAQYRPSFGSFQDRYDLLHKTELPIWRPENNSSLCSIIEHLPLQKSPKALAKMAIELGFEGIMLKTYSHSYQEKRSNDWCKVKAIYTEDLPVIDIIEGSGKYAGKLGALVVRRGDVKVEVGSGFSDLEREEFWLNPPGCIEVKYQEALSSGSLRFPIFVRVRDDKVEEE